MANKIYFIFLIILLTRGSFADGKTKIFIKHKSIQIPLLTIDASIRDTLANRQVLKKVYAKSWLKFFTSVDGDYIATIILTFNNFLQLRGRVKSFLVSLRKISENKENIKEILDKLKGKIPSDCLQGDGVKEKFYKRHENGALCNSSVTLSSGYDEQSIDGNIYIDILSNKKMFYDVLPKHIPYLSLDSSFQNTGYFGSSHNSNYLNEEEAYFIKLCKSCHLEKPFFSTTLPVGLQSVRNAVSRMPRNNDSYKEHLSITSLLLDRRPIRDDLGLRLIEGGPFWVTKDKLNLADSLELFRKKFYQNYKTDKGGKNYGSMVDDLQKDYRRIVEQIKNYLSNKKVRSLIGPSEMDVVPLSTFFRSKIDTGTDIVFRSTASTDVPDNGGCAGVKGLSRLHHDIEASKALNKWFFQRDSKKLSLLRSKLIDPPLGLYNGLKEALARRRKDDWHLSRGNAHGFKMNALTASSKRKYNRMVPFNIWFVMSETGSRKPLGFLGQRSHKTNKKHSKDIRIINWFNDLSSIYNSITLHKQAKSLFDKEVKTASDKRKLKEIKEEIKKTPDFSRMNLLAREMTKGDFVIFNTFNTLHASLAENNFVPTPRCSVEFRLALLWHVKENSPKIGKITPNF